MNEPTKEAIAKLPKWAQAYITDLTKPLEIRLALHPTEPVHPDIPPPTYDGSDKLSKGWLVVGAGHYARVEKGCSSSAYHGSGQTERTTTQNPHALYSTRLLALRAARYEIERYAGGVLLNIDKQIDKEKSTPTPL